MIYMYTEFNILRFDYHNLMDYKLSIVLRESKSFNSVFF